MDLSCEEEMLPEEDSPGAAGDGGTVTGTTAGYAEPYHLLPLNHMQSATLQPELLENPLVLTTMLTSEEFHLPTPNYFKNFQTDLTPEMRRAVATWMYEVCEEERVPECVFLRAINYLDRFLSVHAIQRNQFQLLGAACLLLSSKWSGSVLSSQKLIFYTAHSITLEMLLEWEMLILAQLKWDTCSITPSDFVEPILHRLPDTVSKATNIRERIKTYTAYCATDHMFLIYPPSMIASASIAAALGNQVSQDLLQEVIDQLHTITTIETGLKLEHMGPGDCRLRNMNLVTHDDTSSSSCCFNPSSGSPPRGRDVLKSCVEQLLAKIQTMMLENSQVPGQSPGETISPNGSSSQHHQLEDHAQSMDMDKLGELEQAETPTDVRDIHF